MHKQFLNDAICVSRAAAGLGALLSAALLPAPVFAVCQITSVELPITMSGLRPLVTAKINDTDVTFILDSGAFYSMITPAAAEQLKLTRRRAPAGLRVQGVGGRTDIYLVRVEKFGLKKSSIPNVEFIVGGNENGAGAIGLLGQNVLSMADVEYDLANGVARIVSPNKDCEKSNLAYWAKSQPVVEVELTRPSNGYRDHTTIYVEINGAKVLAAFDTGASVSTLSTDAAKRAGLVPGGAGVIDAGVMHGIGRYEEHSWIAPVKTLKIGTEQISDTHVRFGDIGMAEIDMLIGDDFFLSHRLYVANSQDKIYLTYNGGPVFNLTTNSAAQHGEESASTQPDESVPPADAAGYARRGAAFAARREYERAVADFTKACELDAKNGKYFLQRSQAQLKLGRQAQAMADLNEALRLNPDDVDARMARARLHLAGHDAAAARADLAAADKTAASQANIRRELGSLYLRLDDPAAALVQFNQWVSAHDREVNLPGVLNDRCWTRALLGTELDKALDDCDEAVKSKPDSEAYLDSRGLVYLRQGKTDKALADYEAALHIDPKTPWSLYGRGLIHLRKGEADAGKADIAAAKAVRPTIEDDAKRYGIAP
jgi:tetratricopeptide (TPR) repeat protein/predicted aspartyl protease